MSPTLRRARVLAALAIAVDLDFLWPRWRSAFPYDWSREGL